jgi:hypothetical protein
MGGRMGVGLFFGFVFLVVASFFLVYTVGLSALGGALGVALADEFEGDRDAERFEESAYVEPPAQAVEEERQDER